MFSFRLFLGYFAGLFLFAPSVALARGGEHQVVAYAALLALIISGVLGLLIWLIAFLANRNTSSLRFRKIGRIFVGLLLWIMMIMFFGMIYILLLCIISLLAAYFPFKLARKMIR